MCAPGCLSFKGLWLDFGFGFRLLEVMRSLKSVPCHYCHSLPQSPILTVRHYLTFISRVVLLTQVFCELCHATFDPESEAEISTDGNHRSLEFKIARLPGPRLHELQR